MKSIAFIVSFHLLIIVCGKANVTDTSEVGFKQQLGNHLPMETRFRDETYGSEHTLDHWFQSGKPAIVVMGYFGCPQLCTVVLNSLVESLTEIKPRVGKDFDVFFISIDPSETPALGAKKKQSYVKRYGKPETAPGWHFLTGPTESVQAVAESIGFRYQYDPEIKQYAHASGLVVVTPEGRISQYFYGIEFPPGKLVNAIETAGKGKQGHPVEQLLLLCYRYNPIDGPYGWIIWRTLQGSALLTVGSLGWFIARNVRRERGHRRLK